jgi:hypothetical protein
MTHPSHQTNGASLEDCHTNFFALVSDRDTHARSLARARASKRASERAIFPSGTVSRRRRARATLLCSLSLEMRSIDERENHSARETLPRWPPAFRRTSHVSDDAGEAERTRSERPSSRSER